MNIDDLKKRVATRSKRGRALDTAAVRVSISESEKAAKVFVTIYEQGTARFSEVKQWTPIWVPEENRLYVVYGISEFGYKPQRLANAIGKIAFQNADLYAHIRKNNLMGAYSWKFDAECAKKYIDLSPRYGGPGYDR